MLVMLCVAATMGAQSLFVGTYNVRNASPGNGDVEDGNGWERRKTVIADMINFESPDIFGTQEALHGQVMDMLKLLPDYGYVGVGRDDGKEEGEYSAIFYNKNRFKLLRSGNFWLTDKDINSPSLGWDAACVRICSWGEFKDKTSRLRFFFFNLHMDQAPDEISFSKSVRRVPSDHYPVFVRIHYQK